MVWSLLGNFQQVEISVGSSHNLPARLSEAAHVHVAVSTTGGLSVHGEADAGFHFFVQRLR
jgi:hypothetical protein